MSNWNYKKLEEVCDVRDGTHDSPKYHEKGIPFITSKNLSPSGIDFTDISFISQENHKQFSQRSKVDKGDILFGMIGTVGNPVLINFDLEFSIKNVALLKFGQSKELFNEFAIQVLKSNIILDQFRSKSDGGVQAFVSLTTIRNLDFPVPLIPEQRQIATILSTADAVIEKTQAAIAKYKAIKQGMLQDLFTRGIDSTTGKLRPSYQDAPELYKESKLGWIPKEWLNIPRLGDQINILPGFPFNSRMFNSEGVGLPLIRIRDLLKSKIETFFEGEYPVEYLINEGDILIGMDGDFHIVKWNNKKSALLNQRIMKVSQKHNSLVDINYFYFFLFSFLKDIWEKTTATTVKHLSTYDISEANLFFPTVTEQKLVAERLNSLNQKLQSEQDFLHKQQQIKAGLMNDLLSGKKKVKIKENQMA